MKNKLTFLFLLAIINIGHSQKLVSLNFLVDTLILPSIYCIAFSFETDPQKCNPDIGIITYEMKMEAIYKSMKLNSLDSKKLIEQFVNDQHKTNLAFITEEITELKIMEKICKSHQILSSDIRYGYSQDLVLSFEEALIEKGVRVFSTRSEQITKGNTPEIVKVIISQTSSSSIDETQYYNNNNNKNYWFAPHNSALITKSLDITYIQK